MSDPYETIRELQAELERVQTETSIKLFDQISDMVVFVDEEGSISGFNNGALVQLGAEASSQLGHSLSDLFEGESGNALMALYRTGFNGVGKSEVRLKDGRTMSFSIRSMGARLRFIVLRDVSQREQLEAELHYARRMASVGRLAGEVAHSINNPLSVIQGRLEMLRVLGDAPYQTRRRHLDIIEDHGRRVARIVKNLQIFAQPRTAEPEWHVLRRSVDNAVEAAGRQVDKLDIEFHFSEALEIYADADQCVLFWENILDSAANIAPAGSPLQLYADQEADTVRVRVDIQGGIWPQELLSELRSPYSGTSYRMDPGRGLALAISWGIVQEHGGWMTAANAQNGTCATIEFVFPGPNSVHPTDAQTESGSRTRDILVVDDDPVMGETLSWMISSHGHRAVVVYSAEDALQRLSNELFDGLITDHRLPGMDGETLLEVVGKEWPDMLSRTILTSGLLHRPKDGQLYLQKPFSRDQLGRLLKMIF